ncbi:MAG: hypothetical protein QOG38_3022 [Hyphomicrobiales bacterium]|nr:hypothetical protein [Hyphomicrobiales bacterium]
MRATFRPSPWAGILLAAFAAGAVACSLYLRYRVIQNSEIGVVCDAGLGTAFCRARAGVVFLFQYSVFGWVALAAAALNLARPSVALLAIGLIAAGFGIVLYNVTASAFAVALMILAFARPARTA